MAVLSKKLDPTKTESTPLKMVVESPRKEAYASIGEMCFAFIKCMVGPAALYMPHGFADAGLGTSLVIVLMANVLFAAGVLRLLDCWLARAGQPESFDAATLAASLGGRWCGYVVEFCVCSLQLGVVVTYFIFVDETLRDVWKRATDVAPPSMTWIVIAMILLEGPPATVRNLHKLAGANAMGTLLVATSLAVIAAYACVEIQQGSSDWRWVEANPTKVFLFSGTAVFAFEGGAAVVIPAANSVAPHDRHRVHGATAACILAVMVAYCIFSTLVYIGYGRDVPVIASRALRDNSKAADLVVNGLYVIVALLSFPLQLLPATQILFKDDVVSSSSKHSLLRRRQRRRRSPRVAVDTVPFVALDNDDNYSDEDDVIAEEAKDDDDVESSSPTQVSSSSIPAVDAVISPLCEEEAASVGVRDPEALTYSSERRSSRRKRRGDILRVGLVVILGIIAILGKNSLDHVVSLLGAVSCGPLALIVGPYMHLSIATTKAGRIVDKAIIVAGCAVTVLTFASTLASWHNAES